MCNNPNLDRVNINAYTKFVNFYQFVLEILSRNQIMMNRMMDGMKNNPSIAPLFQSDAIISNWDRSNFIGTPLLFCSVPLISYVFINIHEYANE